MNSINPNQMQGSSSLSNQNIEKLEEVNKRPNELEMSDLPNEMILEIFKHLSGEELTSAGQVNKRLYQLASYHIELRMSHIFDDLKTFLKSLPNEVIPDEIFKNCDSLKNPIPKPDASTIQKDTYRHKLENVLQAAGNKYLSLKGQLAFEKFVENNAFFLKKLANLSLPLSKGMPFAGFQNLLELEKELDNQNLDFQVMLNTIQNIIQNPDFTGVSENYSVIFRIINHYSKPEERLAIVQHLLPELKKTSADLILLPSYKTWLLEKIKPDLQEVYPAIYQEMYSRLNQKQLKGSEIVKVIIEVLEKISATNENS